MIQTKAIKRKTKNRLTLIRNLQKGKARKEDRCPFQSIPYPLKFAYTMEIYRLHADVVLMEQYDTLAMEVSFYNTCKIYKQAQIVKSPLQNLLKVQLENKNVPMLDWRITVEKIASSHSPKIREWAEPVRKYCEKHEKVLQELKSIDQMPDDKYQALVEMNNKYQTTKESLFRSYPCIEFKSQLKDGQIQITEIAYSEKYLAEMGHTTDTFTSTVFEEGLPPLIPIDSHGTRTIAKLRLEKYLGTQDGFQTPEFESVLLMRHGYTKNVKMRIYYNAFYEKGVPGFSFINMIVANQKSTLKKIQPPLGIGLNQGFIEHMIKREKVTADFASKYYDEKVEQKYTNMDKVCQVRELKDEDSL